MDSSAFDVSTIRLIVPLVFLAMILGGMGGALQDSNSIETRACFDESDYFRWELICPAVHRRLDVVALEQLRDE